MNLVLLRAADFVDAAAPVAVLKDRRLTHLRAILRAQVGDTVVVGVEGGQIGRAVITALTHDHAELEVTLAEAPPPPLDVTLALALPRPPTLRKVLQQASALGVKRIALFRAERVEKSYFTSHALHADALAEELRLGLEQARDTVLPGVEIHAQHFSTFCRQVLPALRAGRQVLVAHPGGSAPCPRAPIGPALLIVGPEGGFVPAEVEALAGLGQVIDLGPRILRVETAVVALLARLAP